MQPLWEGYIRQSNKVGQAKQSKRVKDTPTSEALGILHNFLGRIWLKESAKERLSLHTAQNCGTPTTKLPIKGHKKIDGRKAHCAVEKGRQVTNFGVTPQRDGFNLPAGNGWQTRLRVEAGRLGMCRSLPSKTLFTPAFAVAHRVHKPPVLHRMVALQIPPTLNSLLFCRGDWRI